MSMSLVPQELGWLEAPHGVNLTHRPTLATWLVVVPSAYRLSFMACVWGTGSKVPLWKVGPAQGFGKDEFILSLQLSV